MEDKTYEFLKVIIEHNSFLRNLLLDIKYGSTFEEIKKKIQSKSEDIENLIQNFINENKH
jgi:hypothetical protein